MDGREAMTLGSTPYYIHGGFTNPQPGTLHLPPGFRHFPTNPNTQAQSDSRPGSSEPPFSREISQPQHESFGHAINMGVSSGGVPQSEPPLKKKRGRPRKYAPDGGVALGWSTLPVRPKASSDSGSPSQKRNKGRPPGTGRKQQLATLGEWMNNSAGFAFAPHVITIGPGEDIVAKLLTFSQQRPRALCILSGTGTVSSGTLRQPGTMTPTVTFEGQFEILCFSGSYLIAEDGSPHDRTGGISASLSTHDGHVIGGGVGKLIAAGPVQVVVCSFVHGASKIKSKQATSPMGDTDSSPQPDDRSMTTSTHNYGPSPISVWPGSRQVDLRNNPHTDIDLTHG